MTGTVRCPGQPIAVDPRPAQSQVNGSLKRSLAGGAQVDQVDSVT
jgi:hypothetical protein